MRRSRPIGLAVSCWAVLAGCTTDPAPESMTPAPQPLDAPASMAPDFVVFTRTPNWTVAITGRRVLLSAPEGVREFDVASNEALFDGRIVVAKDGRGAMEVRVTPRSCQDPESGAWLPYTARITLDASQPRIGCARDR